MSADQDAPDPLQSLIAEILEAEVRGESVNRDELLQEHPHLADSLRGFFADHDRMRAAADVDPPTLPPKAEDIESEDPTLAPPATPLDDPTVAPTEPSDGEQQVPSVGDQVRYFGDYELLEEIARGGMGVVFKARQINLNRIVALKMILSGQFAGEEDVQRFYTEAEAAAQLDHPGIVPIFEIGEHQGQHYFSMGYVDGDNLAQRVADSPLPPREAAELVRKICDAMAYAHERGVIHRDLKPANILIDGSGQSKVTDFGLAKKTEADSNLTGTGQILGTPAYMPPEQASGGSDVGPLSDVYSIGAILYCLITGRPPFQAANPMDTLLQVIDREPVSIRVLNASVPRDLETITAKCLHKNPKHRYSSSRELGDELDRFLTGQPILARPAGPVERGWRWCQRNRAVASVSALLLFTLIAISIAAPMAALYQASLRSRADELSRKEGKAREDAEHQAERARRGAFNAQLSRVHSIVDAFPQRALGQLNDPSMCPNDLLDLSYHLLRSRSERAGGEFTSERALDIEFSDDGSRVAVASGSVVRIWSLAPLTLEREIEMENTMRAQLPAPAWDIDFSPDGAAIAGAVSDGTVRIWSVESGEQLASLQTTSRNQMPLCVRYAPNGRDLAIGTASRGGKRLSAAILWTLGKSEVRELPEISGRCLSLAFSPDGTRLAGASQDNRVIVWELGKSGPIVRKRLLGHASPIGAVRFSPDGRLLVTAGHQDTSKNSGSEVRVWDLQADYQVTAFDGGPFAYEIPFIPRIDFDFVGSTSIAIPRRDDMITIVEARTGRELSRIVEDSAIKSVAFSSKSGQIAYWADAGEAIKFWNVRRTIMRRVDGRFNSMLVSPDGRRLLAYEQVGDGKSLKSWDFGTFADEVVIDDTSNAFCFLGDDTIALTDGGKVWTQNLATRDNVTLESPGDLTVSGLTSSERGRYLLTYHGQRGDAARELRVWDAATSELQLTASHTSYMNAVVSDASDLILTLDGDEEGSFRYTNAASLWNLQTGQRIGQLPLAEGDTIRHVAFSPHGDRIAVALGSDGYSVYETQSLALSLQDREQYCDHCIFSPDDNQLVAVDWGNSPSRDSTPDRNAAIIIRDLGNGESRVLQGLPNQLFTAAFSPDGKTFLTSGTMNRHSCELAFWDPLSWQQRYVQEDVPNFVGRIVFSSDSRSMLTMHQEVRYGPMPDCYVWNVDPAPGRQRPIRQKDVDTFAQPDIEIVDDVATTDRPQPQIQATDSKSFFSRPQPRPRANAGPGHALIHIGTGLHRHHAAHKRMPPREGVGTTGLSWRVHLLPFVGEAALYREFRLDEPWDSEHNRQLIPRIPKIYSWPSDEVASNGKTRIVVPFHETAIFHDRDRGSQFRDIIDGLAVTIAVIIADEDRAVIWTAPEDLNINLDRPREGWSDGIDSTVPVMMADSAVLYIPEDAEDELVRSLLTRAGREEINQSLKEWRR